MQIHDPQLFSHGKILMSKLARFTGYTLAAVILLALLSWWAWDAVVPHHLGALSDTLRTRVLGAEPHEQRSRALDREIAALKAESLELASSVGKIDGELELSDKTIQRLRSAQHDDRVLLELLKDRLTTSSQGEAIVINGTTYRANDLQHDARIILDRHQACADEIMDEQGYRADLAQHLDTLRSDLRERIKRIRKLEIGQKRVVHLIDQQRFSQWVATLDGQRATSQALVRAEREQEQLVHDLTRTATGLKVMREIATGGPTPVAEALIRESAPSVEQQIDNLLTNSQLTQGQ